MPHRYRTGRTTVAIEPRARRMVGRTLASTLVELAARDRGVLLTTARTALGGESLRPQVLRILHATQGVCVGDVLMSMSPG